VVSVLRRDGAIPWSRCYGETELFRGLGVRSGAIPWSRGYEDTELFRGLGGTERRSNSEVSMRTVARLILGTYRVYSEGS
jgi:hypothetical protein